MEFHLDMPQNQFFIRSVTDKGIRINDQIFDSPFIISGQRIIPEWDVKSIEQINEENLQIIFGLEPEVVLIGTGRTQVFLAPAVQIHFLRRNLGFEVMTTDAACRTFNVLASEGRQVVAAILPVIP